MSQVLVSIDVPRLILGVETSFDSLLGHPAHSLYGKRFDAFIGPCTDSSLLDNVIMNAGFFNSSADVLISFHEQGGHSGMGAACAWQVAGSKTGMSQLSCIHDPGWQSHD